MSNSNDNKHKILSNKELCNVNLISSVNINNLTSINNTNINNNPNHQNPNNMGITPTANQNFNKLESSKALKTNNSYLIKKK